MTFLHPWIDAVGNSSSYLALRDALDRRESIEQLLQRIEHHDSQVQR